MFHDNYIFPTLAVYNAIKLLITQSDSDLSGSKMYLNLSVVNMHTASVKLVHKSRKYLLNYNPWVWFSVFTFFSHLFIWKTVFTAMYVNC